MKAPREARPHTPATPDPQRQPRGPAQRRVDDSARQHEAGARNGGLPAQLRSGLEALSGLDMSDVRVHRNSSKPAQLEAAAYAQGRDIHLAPGQDHHLPHEAWHVVQQRQAIVRPTMQMAGVGVNDNPGLELEADVMGRRAAEGTTQLTAYENDALAPAPHRPSAMPIQLERREFGYYGRDGKKKSQKVIRMEEFGDRNRMHNIDPNKIGEELDEDVEGMGIRKEDIDKDVGIWRPSKAEGTARPEDPPIYQPFRKAFHEAHNIKLSLERDMEGFQKIDLDKGFTTELLGIAATVKKVSVRYKAGVRNFNENPIEALKDAYFLAMGEVTAEVEALSAAMIKAYATETGLEDELEGELGDELLPEIRNSKSEGGSEIWKTRWWAAVQQINGLLVRLWGEHKPHIESWVSEKKEAGLSYMHSEMVGDLDYIGSLAKGYKSAPKQYIRFMPEKFDVDANLDAPPLAVYAISMGGVVDRGSVKSEGIAPLITFEQAVNEALFKFDAGLAEPPTESRVPGLDKDDLFEVFIRASNVTDLMYGSHDDVDAAHKQEGFSNRLQNIQDRIWWLRGRNKEFSDELADMLQKRGFVTDKGTIKEHDPKVEKNDGIKRAYVERDLSVIEVLLKRFEAKAEAAEKEEESSSHLKKRGALEPFDEDSERNPVKKQK